MPPKSASRAGSKPASKPTSASASSSFVAPAAAAPAVAAYTPSAAATATSSMPLKNFNSANLSPLYRHLDNGNFALAAKHVSDLISSVGPHPSLLVFALVCAARMQDPALEPEIAAISARIKTLAPPERLTAQDFNLWQYGIKRRPDADWAQLIATLEAAVALPGATDTMVQMLFTALGRSGAFARQQQLAMKLYSLTKAAPFLCWSATTLLLSLEQQRAHRALLRDRTPTASSATAAIGLCAALPSAKLLALAQGMLARQHPETASQPPAVFDLYLRTILAQSECAAADAADPAAADAARAAAAARALALLAGPAGAGAATHMGPAEAALLRARLMLLRGPSAPVETATALRALAAEQIARAPDDWRWLATHAYLTVGGTHAHPSAVCGLESLPRPLETLCPVAAPADAAAVAEAVAEAVAVYRALGAKSPLVRGPALAAVEAARLGYAANTANSDALAVLCAELVRYFSAYGAAPCAQEDMAAYLDVIAHAPAAASVAALPATLTATAATEAAAPASAAAAVIALLATAPEAAATIRPATALQTALEAAAAAANDADTAAGRSDAGDRAVRRGVTLETARLRLGLVAALDDAALERHAAALAARFVAYEAAPPVSADAAAMAQKLARYNETRNHLELKVPEDAPAPKPTSADPLLPSAAAALLEVAERARLRATRAAAAGDSAARAVAVAAERAAVVDAVLLLELGAGANVDNADARLWLVRLYAHPALGAVGRARELAGESDPGGLRVRTVQNESMAHLWLDDALRWGRRAVAREVAEANEDFVQPHRADDASLTAAAYNEGTYAQVLDFQEFRSRMERSHSFWACNAAAAWDAIVTALTVPVVADADGAVAAAAAARAAASRVVKDTDGLVSAVLARHYGTPAAAALALQPSVTAAAVVTTPEGDALSPALTDAAGEALARVLVQNQDRGIVRCHAAVPATGGNNNAAAAALAAGQLATGFSALATALNAPAPWTMSDSFAAAHGALASLQRDAETSRVFDNVYTLPADGAVSALRVALLLPRCARAGLEHDAPAMRSALAALAALLPTAHCPANHAATAGVDALAARGWALWTRVCETGAVLDEAAAASAEDGTGDAADWEQARALRWQIAATTLVALAADVEAAAAAHATALAAATAAGRVAQEVAAAAALVARPLALVAALLPAWAVAVPAPETARAAVKEQVAAAGRVGLSAAVEEAAGAALAPPRAALVDLVASAGAALETLCGALDAAASATEGPMQHRSMMAYFCTTDADAAAALGAPTEAAPACGGGATHTLPVLQRIAKDQDAARVEAAETGKALLALVKSFAVTS